MQAELFEQSELNDLNAQEFDKSEYIIDAFRLPGIAKAIRAYGKVAFDIETTGLGQDAGLVGVGLAWEDPDLKSVYIPVGHNTQTPQLKTDLVLNFLRSLFPEVLVIPFNAAFEIKVMRRFGVAIPNFTDMKYYAVADDASNSRRSLKDIAKEHLGLEWGTIKQVCSRRIKERNANGRMIHRMLFDIPGTSIETLGRYCRTDVEATLQLYHKFVKTTEYAQSTIALEKQVTPVVISMEERGIRLDVPAVEQKLEETKIKLVELVISITNEIGREINLNSPKQVSELLFDELNLRTVNGRSVDVNTLQELKDDHLVPKHMLEYRELEKLRSTYLEPLLTKQVGGRIFTSFNQLGTESGRFSSNSPNMQNVPLDPSVRKLFIASENMVFFDYDYSQIEGRVFAHVSQDKTLLEYYQKGGDIHTATSEKLGIPRKLAKTINFAIIYGAASKKLADVMQKEGFSYGIVEAKDLIKSFWKLYAGGNKWSSEVKKTLHRDKAVYTTFGRRRNFPMIGSLDAYKTFAAEREAVNFVIQGTAADIMKYALVGCYKALKLTKFPAYMLLQVHDELLFEGPEENYERVDKIIRHQMENAAILSLPLLVEGKKGINWAECH